MKKILIILAVMLMTLSCAVNTSNNINVNTNDIQYVRDDRTGIVFGIVASRASFNTDATGLGCTVIPTDQVESVLPYIK